jgi:hypothetical protein
MPTVTAVTRDEITRIAEEYYNAFPDAREAARECAADLLKKHTGRVYDPDFVYWLRFDNAQNNPLCHSGWQHYGPAKRSLSLTELVMSRFDLFDQINAIDLDNMSGIYILAHSPRFDQTNEVPLLPSLLMQDFWRIDFAGMFHKRLKRFWNEQASHGRLLLKALFSGFSWSAYRDGVLTTDQLKLLFNTLCGRIALPPSVADLRTLNTERRFAKVYSFTLGSQTATDIVRVQSPDGSGVLYMPPSWFKPYRSPQALYEWLRHEAADPQQRARLLRHFGDYTLDTETQDEIIRALDQVQATPWHAGQTDLNAVDIEITKDAFTFLFDNVRARLARDVDILLTTNDDLRKGLLLADLDALIHISSGMAPGDPLIALITLGAVTLSFSAHTVEAVQGKTREDRKLAFRRALLDVVTALFDLPLLKGADNPLVEFADLDEVSLDLPLSSYNSDEWLGYGVATDLNSLPEGTGIHQGIFIRDAKHAYIRMDGVVLQVRYVRSLERWYVVDPQAPDTLFGAWPVVRDWRGRWVRYTVPRVPVEPEVIAPDPQVEHLYRQLQQYETHSDYEPLIEVLTGRNGPRLMAGPLDSVFHDARAQLLQVREELADASTALLNATPPTTGPAVPQVSASLTPALFLETVYSDAYGLIIGEPKGGVASKLFLVKYMGRLKQMGVDTLFVEGLYKDLHQPMIDQFWRIGHMPTSLEKRLIDLFNQTPHLHSGRYTHYRLLVEARRQGIKIKTLDCAASSAADGLPNATPGLAHRMRVFYASERIKAHQARVLPSRWIALIDQTRASPNYGVKGIAELTETVHLRVKDVDRLLPTRLGVDMGEVLKNPPLRVRGDAKLEIGTLGLQGAHEGGVNT